MYHSSEVRAFFDFMKARHDIYLARQAGQPKPWTPDPILQQYRFCNVFRELDTVTVWVKRYIRDAFPHHPNLWFMLCIARQINWPDTLGELMTTGLWPVGDYDSEGVAIALDHRKARGDKVYTGAYMIRAESDRTKPWYSWTKQRYMAEIVLGKVWQRRSEFHELFGNSQGSLQEVHYWLTQFHGWGGFMAYEVVTDLRHTRYLRNAPDIMTWANPGPGARRGLNRIHGRPLKEATKTDQLINEMQYLLGVSRHVDVWDGPTLEMRDIEHTLCEFDKYERMRLGQGSLRSRYNGR